MEVVRSKFIFACFGSLIKNIQNKIYFMFNPVDVFKISLINLPLFMQYNNIRSRTKKSKVSHFLDRVCVVQIVGPCVKSLLDVH